MNKEIERRKTFAIISHPDAGKTTITEKLLLYGGVLREAGSVKAKAGKKHVTSDWMELERKRGISVTTTAIQFEHKGFCINLLDTPGHKDFSEDTYRTLMAVDSAVMLIDAAKGVEEQTKKLFQVCRKAGIPIFTFVNKLDRESKNPLQLIDEIESVLGIKCTPVNWPIGSGQSFRGVYDILKKELHVFDASDAESKSRQIQAKVFESVEEMKTLPNFQSAFVQEALENFNHELELLTVAGTEFDRDQISNGELSPVFFGSAMNNFGIEIFLDYFINLAPAPTPRTTTDGNTQSPYDPFSAVVFKVQANMDVNHRDNLAFLRICSGEYEKGIKVNIPRAEKEYRISNAFSILGRERSTIEQAFAGDIIGIVDTSGQIRIGDTLSVKKNIEYKVWTRFLPEVFADIQIAEPEKRKQLTKGLSQLSGEGIVQCLSDMHMGNIYPTLGAIGILQFDVLASRLESEYNVKVRINKLPYSTSRLLVNPEIADAAYMSSDWVFVKDSDGNIMVLFQTEWSIRSFESLNKTAILAVDYESFYELQKG